MRFVPEATPTPLSLTSSPVAVGKLTYPSGIHSDPFKKKLFRRCPQEISEKATAWKQVYISLPILSVISVISETREELSNWQRGSSLTDSLNQEKFNNTTGRTAFFFFFLGVLKLLLRKIEKTVIIPWLLAVQLAMIDMITGTFLICHRRELIKAICYRLDK